MLVIVFNPDYLSNLDARAGFTVLIALINLYNFVRAFIYVLSHQGETCFHAITAMIALIIFSSMQYRAPLIYQIPFYSIGMVLIIFAMALFFTIRYVNHYDRIARFTLELQQAVNEKTRDIARVNEKLRESNRKLLANEEARKKMMSNISHDLRTPITAIRGYLELMMKAKRLDGQTRQKYLNNMHLRSAQMEEMIDNLVQLTRLESSMDLKSERVSLQAILLDLVDLYVSESKNNQKEIAAKIPKSDRLEVLGDPNHLMRVFDNLIVNAIRYTQDDAKIDVRARREREDDLEFIHIQVKDNGSGIDEKELSYIFDRFYRGKNAGKMKGSGLGLAIVKSIVSRHGGKVWVESKTDVGTTFHVRLPAILSQKTK